MDIDGMTKREREVVQTLLAQRGITNYRLFEVTQEGKHLPGSTYPWEIESMSGYVITTEQVYYFWLDWIDGHYTLGEEDGFWREMTSEKLEGDRDEVLQIQEEMKKG